MLKIEYINEENKEQMKKIVNEQHNELLDDYINHLNNMYERNKEGLNKSVFVYEGDIPILYLDFAVVNKALFLTNKYFIHKYEDTNQIIDLLKNEFKEFDLINLDLS